MFYNKQNGVPKFESIEFSPKTKDYVLLIPIINEGERIIKELIRSRTHKVYDDVDIVICDGGSTDGSTKHDQLQNLHVNALLIKHDQGRQGAQLRMGIWWALKRGYNGIVTIDGNNKDSIEDTPKFVKKLKEGYDFVQGSRFIKGGRAINTPISRLFAVKFIHAPIISITAKHKFTDTTNAFRAYSSTYLKDPAVKPLRDIFMSYNLLAYLSVRASQLGYKVCEIPVTRAYPKCNKTPTKIHGFRGNIELVEILIKNFKGEYLP